MKISVQILKFFINLFKFIYLGKLINNENSLINANDIIVEQNNFNQKNFRARKIKKRNMYITDNLTQLDFLYTAPKFTILKIETIANFSFDSIIIQKNTAKIYSILLERERKFSFPLADLIKNQNIELSCFSISISKKNNLSKLNMTFKKYLKIVISLLITLIIYFFFGVICQDIKTKYGKNSFMIIFMPIFNFFIVKMLIVINLKIALCIFLLIYFGVFIKRISRNPLLSKLMSYVVTKINLQHFELINLFLRIYKKK